MGIVEIVNGEGELLELIAALRAAGGLTRRLDGRKQQANKDAYDGDDDQEFDQRKGPTLSTG
jgi:hypothetical protein